MAAFPLEAVLELTGSAITDVAIVTLRVEDAPEVAAGQIAGARYLDVDTRLAARFRDSLRRALLPLRSRPPVPYEPGWLSVDGETAEADEAVLEGPVMGVVGEALRHDPGSDFAVPARPIADGEAAHDELVVGAYVVVMRAPGRPTAYFIRRRDPVEHLGRGLFSALWSPTRLDTGERVFTFDSSFDLAVFDGQVLVRNAHALEALFSNETARREGARLAVATLGARIPLVNVADLLRVIGTDSRFASRLRAIDRRGQLARLDRDAVRRTTERFEIVHRMLRDGQLVFLPGWRFIWLSVLEDSLVESPGTQARYTARIKSVWRRQEVTCLVRDTAGTVISLRGDWGEVGAPAAARQIRSGAVTYYADVGGRRIEIDVAEADGGRGLVGRLGDDEGDHLGDLPGCEPRP